MSEQAGDGEDAIQAAPGVAPAGSDRAEGATGAARAEALGDNPPGGDLTSVEIVTTEVEDDGTIVVDDFVAEVDAAGHVVATDELVEIDLPDGTVIMDETFSVADASGELVVIDEETIVLTPEPAEDEAPESGGAPGTPRAGGAESNGNGSPSEA